MSGNNSGGGARLIYILIAALIIWAVYQGCEMAEYKKNLDTIQERDNKEFERIERRKPGHTPWTQPTNRKPDTTGLEKGE